VPLIWNIKPRESIELGKEQITITNGSDVTCRLIIEKTKPHEGTSEVKLKNEDGNEFQKFKKQRLS